ncbi:P22 phage major capsid protein family protein [Methylobacterium sp. 1030]|uniref:P22 phage major capsid protein family protein n=1 Tax=Methylobacterium sp. 1030 TaxID=3156404 RepID=UPI003393791A
MANSILTPTAVTREALRILHQKLNFVGSINRSYDDSYAKEGAKIGDTLKIRQPNQYKVRTGATLSAQDTNETSVDLKIQTQKGVDVNFSSAELTLNLDDFSKRILDPAMAVLAANIEADAFNMYKDVYQQVGAPGTVPNSLKVLNQARAKLTDSLAPTTDRSIILNTDAQVEISDALKGLFNPQDKISKAYRDGVLAPNTVSFGDIYENTIVPVHTNGSATGSLTVTGAPVEGSNTINLTGTGTQTLTKGTVITIAGVQSVHPETKVASGKLQQFVVTADVAAVGGSYTGVQVSPAFIASNTNPRQNISALPATSALVTVSGSASTGYAQNMAFQKDAFAFATADLIMPKGVDWSAREVMDGLSMRIVRQYDINNDKFPCRIDIMYGYATIRPQLACRITA